MRPGLVYFDLHHVPVPGNLGQHSERDGGAEVGQWRRLGIVSTHRLSLVRGNGEALADEWDFYVPHLAHLFQGFGIYFENEFAGPMLGARPIGGFVSGMRFLEQRVAAHHLYLITRAA